MADEAAASAVRLTDGRLTAGVVLAGLPFRTHRRPGMPATGRSRDAPLRLTGQTQVPGQAEGVLLGGSLGQLRAMLGAGLPALDDTILLLALEVSTSTACRSVLTPPGPGGHPSVGGS